MAVNETTTLLIDVQVSASEALKRQQELKVSLEQQKAALVSLEKEQGKTSQAYIAQEATVKNLNNQLAANQRVLTQMAGTSTNVSGAYAQLNQKYVESAQKAKDMAAAYGTNDERTKAAVKSAYDFNEQLKAIDKSVGQNQRSVGDYGIAVKKLPGIFGEMQEKGQSVLVSLRTKFDSVKDATMSVRDAMQQSREATAKAMLAAEQAAIAEQALATAEKTGAATATLAAEAEAARAVATETATVATNLGSKAMQIFKVALISTGIGALVVALGAVVAYFTQTNEGGKQFAKISAGISAVLQSGIKILGSYGKLLFAIATFDLKKIKEGWSEIGENIKNATGDIKENYKAGVQNTANQQMMAKREREWSGEKLKLLKEYEEARFNAGKKSKLDDEGKIKAAKEAMKINELIFQNDLKIAQNKAKMVENEQKLVSKKDYQAIQDAKNKVQEIINAHGMQQLTVDALLGKAEKREEEANDASVKSNQEKLDKINKDNEEWRKQQTEAEIKDQDEAYKKMIESRDAALKAVEDLQFGIAEEPEVDTGSAIQYQQDLEDAKQAIRESSDIAYLEYQQTQLDLEYKAAIANAKKVGADTTAIEAAYVENKKKINKAEISAKMDMASNFAGNIAEIFGKNTKVGKMAASAQIAIDTAKGAMAAFTSMQSIPVVGVGLGVAAAGAVIAKGARSIKDVWAVKSGLPGDGGGGGASVSTAAASGGSVAAVTGSLVSRQSGQTQQTATQQAMTEAVKAQPIQPVLVTNDLTTALNQKVQIKSDNSL